MPTCVEGHTSVAVDYCDVCGAAMGTVAAETVVAPSSELKACPACGMPVSGRFCEECGHDSALPAPVDPVAVVRNEPVPNEPVPVAAWTAVIAADLEFHARVVAREGPDSVEFPAFFPSRRIVLSGGTTLIGRANARKGIDPEIDLSIDPADIGVSTQHAVIRVTDSGVTITDLGSTNGTSLNSSEDLLTKGVETPLQAGDRIHVGAWTTITVVRA